MHEEWENLYPRALDDWCESERGELRCLGNNFEPRIKRMSSGQTGGTLWTVVILKNFLPFMLDEAIIQFNPDSSREAFFFLLSPPCAMLSQFSRRTRETISSTVAVNSLLVFVNFVRTGDDDVFITENPSRATLCSACDKNIRLYRLIT